MAGDHADVVVVAAGASQRFGSDKLDVDIGGRPLLAWTIDRIAASPLVDRIVIVTAGERVEGVRAAGWLSSKVADVVAGGSRRQDSVANGVAAVAELGRTVDDEADDRVVLVHDGARPLIEPELVAAVIAAVRTYGAAVPMLPIVETVKRVDPDGRIVETVDRAGLAVVQTPQGATLETLVGAFRAMAVDGREFTDEAALLEACTIPVHAIPGDPDNIKVTQPADLARVAAVLAPVAPLAGAAADTAPRDGDRAIRVGLGTDSHPFGPGDDLALGGLRVPGGPRLHGHSDGDVVLHAIADALLGGAALGDLGRLFPAGPETPRGIASAEMLDGVRERVIEAGWAVDGIDATIVAGRPKLAPHLPAMAARIAEILGIDVGAVNVKASTGNLDGADGAGRGISATAIATLSRARTGGPT